MVQVWVKGAVSALSLGARAFSPTAHAQNDAGEIIATLFELDDTTAAAESVGMRWAGINRGTPAGLIVPAPKAAAPGAAATAKSSAMKQAPGPRKDE